MQTNNQTFDHLIVVKRSGQRVSFNGAKIAVAVKYAFDSVYEQYDEKNVNKIYKEVLDYIAMEYEDRKTINVEDIQDIIEKILQKETFHDVYLSFNEYRLRRAASREVFSVKQQHKFVKAIEKIGLTVKNNEKDKPMDLMFNFGTTISKEFTKAYLLENKYVRAHEEGLICIRDLDSYALATTSSSHIDFSKTKANRLHEFIDICIDTITHFKEEQYGEQTISSVDTLLAPVLLKEFSSTYRRLLIHALKMQGFYEYMELEKLEKLIQEIETIQEKNQFDCFIKNDKLAQLFKTVHVLALEEVEERLCENIKKLVLCLNSFKNRLGSSTVSISLGDANTYENKWIASAYLHVLDEVEPLKNVVTIYKIDTSEEDSLLEKVEKLVMDKKNITFFFPKQLGKNEKEAEIFSTGEVVYQNVNSDKQTSHGRILISSSAVNLARLGMSYSEREMKGFYEELEDMLELSKNQLLQRFEIQANKYKENYDYLLRDSYIYESKKLEAHQKIRKVIRHGTFVLEYIGLGECICALKGKKELDKEDFKLGNEILTFMQDKTNKFILDHKLNFILNETNDKKTLKKVLGIDKSVFGALPILKKPCYETIAGYLEHLPLEDRIEIGSLYQKRSGMILEIIFPKSTSKKRIYDLLISAEKKGITYLKVQVGKT